MKVKAFLKDRIFIYISYAATLGIIFMFLNAFRTNYQLKLIIGTVFVLMVMVNEAREILRKKFFYE